MKRCGVRWLAAMAVGLWAGAMGAEETWDEAGARKVVEKVLAVEKAGQPWNKIGWVKDAPAAAAAGKKSGRPILVFFYRAKGGPEAEPCGPGGRVMRSVVLADPKVQALIKEKFVPLKVGLAKGGEFPLDWPALQGWARLFQFADGRTFTGCAVVSPDREVEFGSTGSLMLWEMVEPGGFDAGKMRAMLELAAGRSREERGLRTIGRITSEERAEEIRRFRQGLARAAKENKRFQLPPEGFSAEKVRGWFVPEN